MSHRESPDAAAGAIVDRLANKTLTIDAPNQQIHAEALRCSGGKVSAAARLIGGTRPQFIYRQKETSR